MNRPAYRQADDLIYCLQRDKKAHVEAVDRLSYCRERFERTGSIALPVFFMEEGSSRRADLSLGQLVLLERIANERLLRAVEALIDFCAARAEGAP